MHWLIGKCLVSQLDNANSFFYLNNLKRPKMLQPLSIGPDETNLTEYDSSDEIFVNFSTVNEPADFEQSFLW